MVGTIPKVQVCYSLTFYEYLLGKEKTFSKFVTTSNEVMKKRQKERAMHELEFREFKFKFKQKKSHKGKEAFTRKSYDNKEFNDYSSFVNIVTLRVSEGLYLVVIFHFGLKMKTINIFDIGRRRIVPKMEKGTNSIHFSSQKKIN